MKPQPHICALLAAAGVGRRLAVETGETTLPKAFLAIGGRPMLLFSLAVLRQTAEISDIIVLAPPAWVEQARLLLTPSPGGKNELVVAGGESRQESVYRGLLALPPDTDFVLIHDAARPFLTAELVRDCLASARRHGAATCAMPATDTIKTSADGEWVESTLERGRLWSIQTPQAFSYRLIREAHEQARRQGVEASDDATLVEKLGERVQLCAGSPENIKITRPADLKLANRILSQNWAPRIGLGFDVHAFGEGRKLILAGVEFPGPGLAGHSDADLICHAVMDALLGAAGLGDIGAHFPDTDPQYAGASSLGLLERVGELLAAAGLQLAWLDIVLAAQEPKIAPHAPQLRENLARALKVNSGCISLKGKTTEGLGFVGRKEGMACWAVCTVVESG